MGGVVSQNGHPIAFFSRKFNTAQSKYTTTEQELLGITETLKAFRTMLLGQRLNVWTDHQNLVHESTKFSCDRVLRQRLTIEEYGANIRYIKGTDNVVTDALSRLPIEGQEWPTEEVNLLQDEPLPPFHTDRIHENLSTCDELPGLLKRSKAKSFIRPRTVNDLTMYEYKSTKAPSNDFKIYIPRALRQELLEWYHDQLIHPGTTRMMATIGQAFSWPGWSSDIKHLVGNCDKCQRNKITAGRRYGKLPRDNRTRDIPWNDVHVDLIGPWSVDVTLPDGSTQPHSISALTCIDSATQWPEFVATAHKTSFHISKLFDSHWICRYPRPLRVIYDSGGEFQGFEF